MSELGKPVYSYLLTSDGQGHLKVDEVVRCMDCDLSHKDGSLCNLFASWVPIAGGDEYECMPADVEPDGFCAWGKRRKNK